MALRGGPVIAWFCGLCIVTLFVTSRWSGNEEWFAFAVIPNLFASGPPPLVLAATNFFSRKAMQSKFLNSSRTPCPVECEYTDDIARYNESAVALFHMRNLNEDLLHRMARLRNPARLNVLYSAEAPPNEHFDLTRVPHAFFNLTLTYWRKSDLPTTNIYGALEAIGPGEEEDGEIVWQEEEVELLVAKKSQLAVQVVSNCHTHSKREILTHRFPPNASIAVLGRCANRTCNNECYAQELQKSFFYLAFENSVCDDYVTEKFWNFKKHLVVPVVLKRSVVSGIVPDEYFLALDDFPNLEALVAKMENVAQNRTAYKSFLSWTKKFRKTTAEKNIFCTACQKAHERAQGTIPNIAAWWREYASTCRRAFAATWLTRSLSTSSSVPTTTPSVRAPSQD